ncbi:MAG: hypothetical protein PHG02_03430, partial [Oscillospiraceae bacterium]|nr:hypothetical protein [Oscillospiraceae bacterium]
LGYIDLQAFEVGEEYPFEVMLPAKFINTDNIISVTATIDAKNLSTKVVTVSDIRVINVPQNYDVSVETQKIYNVTLVGPEAELDELQANNVIAQMDANNITFAKGQQNAPVNIIVPSSNNIFASGSYTALINISVK